MYRITILWTGGQSMKHFLMELRASGFRRNGTCGRFTGGRVEGCGCEASRVGVV